MRTTKKLAIFFTSIPRDRAIAIMKHFNIKTMEAIASEIRSLGVIPRQQQGDVFVELSEKIAQGVNPTGGEEVAKQILKGVVGEEEARKLLERATPRKPKPFSKIVHINAQDLATILSKEQFSTVAIILKYFPAKKIAEVIVHFEPDFREEVVIRLAQDITPDPDIVERIEEVFVNKVISSVRTSGDEDEDEKQSIPGGPEFCAEVMQSVTKEIEEELIAAIQEENPELAEKIRDMMFTFEDILQLTDSDIQKILREIPTDKLVIALRGASQELSDKFMNNLSKRAKENLLEEMDMMGKVKKSEVEAERKVIVGIIRALEAAGDIALATGEGGDEYV